MNYYNTYHEIAINSEKSYTEKLAEINDKLNDLFVNTHARLSKEYGNEVFGRLDRTDETAELIGSIYKWRFKDFANNEKKIEILTIKVIAAENQKTTKNNYIQMFMDDNKIKEGELFQVLKDEDTNHMSASTYRIKNNILLDNRDISNAGLLLSLIAGEYNIMPPIKYNNIVKINSEEYMQIYTKTNIPYDFAETARVVLLWFPGNEKYLCSKCRGIMKNTNFQELDFVYLRPSFFKSVNRSFRRQILRDKNVVVIFKWEEVEQCLRKKL